MLPKKDYSITALISILRTDANAILLESKKVCSSSDPVKAYAYLCDVGDALRVFTETFDIVDKKIYSKAKDVEK